jgi:hypothetical protein
LHQYQSGLVRIVCKLGWQAEQEGVIRRWDDIGDDNGHVGKATNLRGTGLLREDTYIVSRAVGVLRVVASRSQQHGDDTLHAVQRVQAADEDTLGPDGAGSSFVFLR